MKRGDLLLGHIAVYTTFQWVCIGKDGGNSLNRIHRPLETCQIFLIAAECLRTVGHAYWFSKKMADFVPAVPGGRAMFSEELSSDGKGENLQ